MEPRPGLAASPSLARAGIGFRPQRPDDHAFLRALYGANRARELAMVPWPDAAKQRFLDDQFRLQSAHFAASNPGADMLVIVRAAPPMAEVPIGRLGLDRTGDTWHLLEIALVPAEQGKGLGTALLRWLMAGAGAPGLSLYVARDNPRAAALYARLGFLAHAASTASHLRMEWRP